MATEPPKPKFVIGVDGGGTSTDCAVVTLGGEVLAISSAGASNPRRVGVDAAVDHVREAVMSACAGAGLSPPAEWASYCVAGAGAHDTRKSILPRLQALGLSHGVTLDHDARAALVSAHGFCPGVVVIAGTGAIAFAQDGDGNEVKVDGWGPLLGDEGSGYWIGLESLKAAVRAIDGRGPATGLVQEVMRAMQVTEPRDLVMVLPLDRTNSELISPLARICIELSRRDDCVARRIVEEAAQCLAASAAAAFRAVDAGQSARVALMGGIATCPEIVSEVREVFSREYPLAAFVEPMFPQSVGAAVVSLRAAGVPVDDTLTRKLQKSAAQLQAR